MLLEINSDNPDKRKIKQIVSILEKGGVIIYPTDTVYGLGCDITNHKAYQKICRIRGLKPEKANFSFICNDLKNISEYTLPFSNEAFRMMKKTLPGPYTYILKGSSKVPKMFKNKKRTIGVRMQNSNIIKAILEELGRPILSASLKSEDDFLEYYTDPYEIAEVFEHQVDAIIDGGYGNNEASSIIDFTSGEAVVLREGAGDVSFI
jgi:tRNA threonylcarbamoyl adenosine modification protein (Sua5/YciO/YrdC/YwlC family)